MEQLGDFVENKSKVYLLKNFLYELKQNQRQWYYRFNELLLKHSFVISGYDICVYTLKRNEKSILYLLYIDDILTISFSKTKITKLKKTLNGEFWMKDYGKAEKILGIISWELAKRVNYYHLDLVTWKKWRTNLECKMPKVSTLIWVITRTFQLCNVLKQEKKDDG